MNVERMKAEAERLRNWGKFNSDIDFNMGEYYTHKDSCGTITRG